MLRDVMARHLASLDGLILSIHRACLSEDTWAQVIRELSKALHARGASLVRAGRGAHIQPSATLFEFEAARVKEYLEYWGSHDLWYQGAQRIGRFGVGVVNVGDQLVDYREYRKSAYFNDYLKPMDIERMLGVCVSGPDSTYGATALSFYRGVGKETFSGNDIELLSRLGPHIGVAVQNHQAVQRMRLLARLHADALDAITAAVFGLEPSGRVALANRAGEELLRQGRWVQQIDRALAPSTSVLEATALAKGLHRLSLGLSFKLVVTDRPTGAQAMLSGAPLSRGENGAVHPAELSALIWLIPIAPCASVATDLAKLFALTPAETRLVARLIAGEELREAAQGLSISLHTARTELKSVFAKTGRRSQAALLSLAARLSTLRTPTA